MSANWFGNEIQGYLGLMFGPIEGNGDDIVIEGVFVEDAVAAIAAFGAQIDDTLLSVASQECQLDFYCLLEEALNVAETEQTTVDFSASVVEGELSLVDSLDATISGTSVSEGLVAQDATEATLISATISSSSIGGSGGGRSIYIESYRFKDGEVVSIDDEAQEIRLPTIVVGGGIGKISLNATASGFRPSREFKVKLSATSFKIRKVVVSASVITISDGCYAKHKLSVRVNPRITHFAGGRIGHKLRIDRLNIYKTTSSVGKAQFALKLPNPSVEVGTFGRAQINARLLVQKPNPIHTIEFSDEQMALIATMAEEMMMEN